MTLRLNLGCGGQFADGWVNVDRDFVPPTVRTDVLKLDIAHDPWPWGDDTVDGIVLHHVIDLLTVAELDTVLAECHRVLRPGGVVRVSLADFYKAILAALHGEYDFFVEKRFDMESDLGHFILQGGARKQWITETVWWAMAGTLGFLSSHSAQGELPTRGESWLTQLDSRHRESWFAEATK